MIKWMKQKKSKHNKSIPSDVNSIPYIHKHYLPIIIEMTAWEDPIG